MVEVYVGKGYEKIYAESVVRYERLAYKTEEALYVQTYYVWQERVSYRLR